MSEKVLPIPCTKVEELTIKDWFQKINEELDELKEVILRDAEDKLDTEIIEMLFYFATDKNEIAEEAADTITAITSMLEAMGIDEDMRQEAQRKVNERNKERGRI